MVTPARPERIVVWMLCRLLPQGFRARQKAEWSGDLVALSASGVGTRWRYLFAAAWTLPALRAHAGKTGVDRPLTIVAPSPPVTTLVRILLVGLGVPVLSWLIAVPFRYYLLDVPARLAPGSTMAFDPKDLWPMEGPFIVLLPLWIVLHLGAWAIIFDWLLLIWVGLTAAVLGPAQPRAGWRHRVGFGLLGVGLIVGALTFSRTTQLLFPFTRPGLATAALGGIAFLLGVGARRVSGLKRAGLVLIGLIGIALYPWHFTPLGSAMLSWLMD